MLVRMIMALVLVLVLVLTSSMRIPIAGRIGRVCLVLDVEFLVCWQAMLTYWKEKAGGGERNIVLVEISVVLDRVCFCV